MDIEHKITDIANFFTKTRVDFKDVDSNYEEIEKLKTDFKLMK